MKILIVDDDKNINDLIKEAILADGTYEVDTAFSGEEALEKLKKEDYDLLLLDIMMPNISGLELCDLMMKDDEVKEVPVFIVSAVPFASKHFQESLIRFRELKMVKGIIEKPFKIKDLIEKIKDFLK